MKLCVCEREIRVSGKGKESDGSSRVGSPPKSKKHLRGEAIKRDAQGGPLTSASSIFKSVYKLGHYPKAQPMLLSEASQWPD